MPAVRKTRVEDLARLGGRPLFDTVRPIAQLAAPDEEAFFSSARSIYASMRITNDGPLVRQLEQRLAALHGVDHCVTFANAGLGLILLLETFAAGRRGEVIMPAFTYAGLPHIAQWAGQRPHFVDIDPDTHTLDPAAVARAIGRETTSILAVHQVNSLCPVEALEEIAREHHIPLIFDSVHAISCTYKGRPVGASGRAEAFSLHATKLLNGFEGGYVTTTDAELAGTLRVKRNFGMDSAGSMLCLGLNAKLNELHAACALASLGNLGEVIRRNHDRCRAYAREFRGIPGLSWVPYRDDGERMNHEYALLVVPPEWPVSRDALVELLIAENAWARAYYSPPLHRSADCPGLIEPPPLPVTERIARQVVQMPVGELVSEDDIALLADLVRFIHAHATEIVGRLGRKRAAS